MNTVVVEFFNVNKINESPAIGATSPCWISSICPAGSRLGSPHAILYESIYLPCLPLFVLMLAHIIIMRSTFIINICLVAVVSHDFHSISLAWGSEDERIQPCCYISSVALKSLVPLASAAHLSPLCFAMIQTLNGNPAYSKGCLHLD